YTDDALDLCDVLSSFAPNAKASLHELCKVMGMAGKPGGIDGSEVSRHFLEGKIKEIADYCETDDIGFVIGIGRLLPEITPDKIGLSIVVNVGNDGLPMSALGTEGTFQPRWSLFAIGQLKSGGTDDA
ncbi:MAG: hypothetical protein WBZ28_19805, partial [Pseudolabrys sp.]